jgi:hypothetical protein
VRERAWGSRRRCEAKTKHVRIVSLLWHSSGSQARRRRPGRHRGRGRRVQALLHLPSAPRSAACSRFVYALPGLPLFVVVVRQDAQLRGWGVERRWKLRVAWCSSQAACALWVPWRHCTLLTAVSARAVGALARSPGAWATPGCRRVNSSQPCDEETFNVDA